MADVCQDTLLFAVFHIDRFEGRSTLWYWVRGIGTNKALLRLRQQRRRAEVSLDGGADAPFYHAPSEDRWRLTCTGADDIVEQAELVERIRCAIAELPRMYSEIVVLCDLRGHSTSEAAEILGVRPGSARVRLHRARRALRSSLGDVIGCDDGRA